MWHKNKKVEKPQKSIDKRHLATYNRHIATKQAGKTGWSDMAAHKWRGGQAETSGRKRGIRHEEVRNIGIRKNM